MEGDRLFATLCPCGLRRAVVAMMQTAESRTSSDATGLQGTNPATRRLLPKSKMSAILVVIADIVGEQPLQMSLIQDDHMIQ
jgi:hypothetical protein